MLTDTDEFSAYHMTSDPKISTFLKALLRLFNYEEFVVFHFFEEDRGIFSC